MSISKNQALNITFRPVNSKTFEFEKKCKTIAYGILAKECKLIPNKTKTKWLNNNIYYPLEIVSIGQRVPAKKKVTMAFYEPSRYQINFYYTLCQALPFQDLENLIRHELAHYLSHIIYGGDLTPHGTYFQKICQKFSWDSRVSAATYEGILESTQPEDEQVKNELSRKQNKIQKLLALAQNNENGFESEVAKSYLQLRLEEYKSRLQDHSEKQMEEEWEIWELNNQKRMDTWHRCMIELLTLFPVKSVLVKTLEGSCVQVMGKLNDLAECVIFLEQVKFFTETEWKKFKLSNGNSNVTLGKIAKNSFVCSLSTHLVKRFSSDNTNMDNAELSPATLGQLMMPSEALEHSFSKIYPRLRSSHSSRSFDPAAAKWGQVAAHKFHPKKGVTQSCEISLLPPPAY